MQTHNRKLHRTNRGIIRLLTIALCLLLMLCAASTACAIDPITGDSVSLTVEVIVGDEKNIPAVGMTFKLYRVADMDEFGACRQSGDFAYDPIFANGKIPTDLSSAEWDNLAQTFESYAALPGRSCLTKKIGLDGRLTFSGLKIGLYLLIGESCKIGSTTYYTSPTLVALPSRNEKDQWLHHVTVLPKMESETDCPSGGGSSDPYIDIEVVKIWKDCNYANRPVSITVDLMQNGCVIRSAVLCAANNWRYTWSDVPNTGKRTVVERSVPDGYTVKYCWDSRRRVVVTNTRPGTTTTITKLPQTGQLWWPVPLLAGGGMVLFVTGWLRRRRHEEE